MYFITILSTLSSDDGKANEVFDWKCVGYVSKFETAEDIVLNNYNDLWQNYYDRCMIEYIEEGIYPKIQKRWFYKYNDDEDGYIQIDEPEMFEHRCSFGIG
jgi:hypothetical protein